MRAVVRGWLQGIAIATAAIVCLAAWCWFRLGIAADRAAMTVASVQQQQATLQRVADLRHRLGIGDREPMAEAALTALVQEVVRGCGLPATTVVAVMPRPGAAPGTAVQTEEVDLAGVSPEQLGAWCQRWSGLRSGWRISSLAWAVGEPTATPGLDRPATTVRLQLTAPLGE